jgi:hypothetical protein
VLRRRKPLPGSGADILSARHRTEAAAGSNGTIAGVSPDQEPPPLFGSWRSIYRLVLLYLGALIVIFFLFGRWATP